jgi:hypothetical protein
MRDSVKVKAWKKQDRDRKMVAKYGSIALHQSMIGRHGRHRAGPRNPRWNATKLVTSHGYIIVRVDPKHQRAFGAPGLKRFKYAYEHDLIAEEMLGRSLTDNEAVHHKNGIRDDNRRENLEVLTRSDHARRHASFPGARDRDGHFSSGTPRSARDSSVQQFPRED